MAISTLREILCRLSAEGLVLAEGQRGFEVPPVTAQKLRELAELRLLLESHAIGAVLRGRRHRMGGPRRRGAPQARRSRAADARRASARPQLWKRYDWEFHQALISACGSRALMEAHASAFDRYLRYQMVAFCFRGEVAAAEHRSLRDCALGRDARQAIVALEEHIGGCVEYTLASGAVA